MHERVRFAREFEFRGVIETELGPEHKLEIKWLAHLAAADVRRDELLEEGYAPSEILANGTRVHKLAGSHRCIRTNFWVAVRPVVWFTDPMPETP